MGLKKILLVDDEEVVRLSFKRELSEEFEVITARNGEDAFLKLQDSFFDVVVTDLVMSGAGGLDVLRRAKSISPDICVILITGYGELESVVEALRLGVDDYLLKPCGPEELLFRVWKGLKKTEKLEKLKNYERILSSTDDLVVLVDSTYNHLEANDAYLETVGRSKNMVLGKTLTDIFGLEVFRQKLKNNLDQCFAGESVMFKDIFWFLKKGRCAMSVTCTPCLRKSGYPDAVLNFREICDKDQEMAALLDSEERLRLAFDVSSDGLWEFDLTTGKVHYDENWCRLFGYGKKTSAEVLTPWVEMVHPDEKAAAVLQLESLQQGRHERYGGEFRMRNAQASYQWVASRAIVAARDSAGKPSRIVGIHRDISATMAWEESQYLIKKNLEKKVAACNRLLQIEREKVEDTNTTLEVLLEKRDQDRAEIEEQLLANVKQLTAPLLEKLRRTKLDTAQEQLVKIIQANLEEITAPFINRLSSKHLNLTPMELQVANHVKQGRSTKEIAAMLHLAPETINVHRKNIRKKLGIRNKHINLRTLLASLS